MSSTAVGATLKVANTGVDSANCGKTGSPTCRSISQAIINAVAGDTISVGPGRYGDLNSDGDYDDPGDERGTPQCVLCISKPVRIISTHGANVTLIDGGQPPDITNPILDVVRIRAPNVTFGALNSGFTLFSRYHPFTAEPFGRNGLDARGSNIQIAGNKALGFRIGFVIPAPSGNITLTSNTAIANDVGFSVTTGTVASTITTSGNVVTHSREWAMSFNTRYSGQNAISRTSIVASGNKLAANANGFLVSTASPVVLGDNIIAGNRGSGVLTEGYGGTGVVAHTFTGNDVLGNVGPGFAVTIGTHATIQSGNIFGNDESGTNCGILNASGQPVNATNNYWGRAAGPGPNRADNAGAGSGCDTSGATTVAPYSAQFFPIALPAGISPPAGAIRVENNGVDSQTCGRSGAPSCRSISRGISNAVAGETILVGPGRYGDLNDDGFFDDIGDERAELPEDTSADFCILCIRKSVRIFSTHGAAITVVDAGPGVQYTYSSDIPYNVVQLLAPSASFGEKNLGFAIAGGFANGIENTGLNTRIAGNTIAELGLGIFSFGRRSYFGFNTLVLNSVGMRVSGSTTADTITSNLAMANLIHGFELSEAIASSANIASANFLGGFTADVSPTTSLRYNAAIGNLEAGFRGSGAYSGNEALGNSGPGFHIEAAAVLNTNNIFGNQEGRNCGVLNESGLTIDARNNYWGAATGPGPNRADNAGAGSGCDASGTTIVKPFSTSIFPITR